MTEEEKHQTVFKRYLDQYGLGSFKVPEEYCDKKNVITVNVWFIVSVVLFLILIFK